MNLHERQQFDFLLQTATERFAQRLTQRNAGAEQALTVLRADANGEGVWLDKFVDALFADFLLDNVDGACFVLAALAKRVAPPVASGKIEAVLVEMAKAAFGALLLQKTDEALEQSASYQAVDFGGRG